MTKVIGENAVVAEQYREDNMKWSTPPNSSRRVIKLFAIFPTKMSYKDTQVWLQFYYVVQEYFYCRWISSSYHETREEAEKYLKEDD